MFGAIMKRLTGDKGLRLCQSPAEAHFYKAAGPLRRYGEIKPQYRIGRYRVDFAIPAVRFVIEIDGFDFHSSKEQVAADVARQRAITAAGWTVLRFTGSEVYAGAPECVREVDKIIRAWAF